MVTIMEQNPENVTKRPKGFQPGNPGRLPGAKNRVTVAREQAIRMAKENPGIDAQSFLFSVMRDPNEDMDRRIDCAKAILPTTHPRLQSLKVDNTPKVESDMTPDQLYATLIEMLIRSGAINPKLLTVTPTSMGIVPATDVIDGEMEEVDE